eukprot:6206266-Pleurochrysis_carterae.AAC.1
MRKKAEERERACQRPSEERNSSYHAMLNETTVSSVDTSKRNRKGIFARLLATMRRKNETIEEKKIFKKRELKRQERRRRRRAWERMKQTECAKGQDEVASKRLDTTPPN